MNNAIEWNKKGIQFYHQYQFQDALMAFRKAIQLDEFNAIYHKNLGDALYELGKIGDACQSYQKAIKLDPINRQILKDYGLILETQKKWNDAFHVFQRALKCGPIRHLEDHYINHHLAAILFEMKEYTQARDLYLQLLKGNFFDLTVLYGLSKCYFVLHDIEMARAYIDIAMDISSDELCPYLFPFF